MAERRSMCSRLKPEPRHGRPLRFDLTSAYREAQSIAPVSHEERQAIVSLPMTIRAVREDHDVVRDQDRPRNAVLSSKASLAATRS